MTEQEFLKKIKTSEGCSFWEGAKGGRCQHGQVVYKGKLYYAHRLSYTLTVGEIPEGKEVLHTCDNPSCIKPEHLYLGDQKDNVRDVIERGHFGTSKLSKEDVIDVLKSHYNNQETGASIARRYKVSQTAICEIVKGRHYLDIFSEVVNELTSSKRLARVVLGIHAKVRAACTI